MKWSILRGRGYSRDVRHSLPCSFFFIPPPSRTRNQLIRTNILEVPSTLSFAVQSVASDALLRCSWLLRVHISAQDQKAIHLSSPCLLDNCTVAVARSAMLSERCTQQPDISSISQTIQARRETTGVHRVPPPPILPILEVERMLPAIPARKALGNWKKERKQVICGKESWKIYRCLDCWTVCQLERHNGPPKSKNPLTFHDLQYQYPRHHSQVS